VVQLISTITLIESGFYPYLAVLLTFVTSSSVVSMHYSIISGLEYSCACMFVQCDYNRP